MKVISAEGDDQLKNGDEKDALLEGNAAHLSEENKVLLVSDHQEQGRWYSRQKESRGRWEGEKVDTAGEEFSLS